MSIKKPYLIIFWFLPLYVAMSTVSITEIGLGNYISFVQLSLVLFGLFYLLIKSTTTTLSFSVLFILLLLAMNMLYSDVREYQLVVYLMGYAFMVHMIARKYPYEIWSQYYLICLVITCFAIIDFVSFFLLGDFIISYRTPEASISTGMALPRINTIFDEPSHQAFFLMPAVIFCLVNNSKMRYLLLFGLLSTMSVAALIMFSFALLVYLRKKLLRNLVSMSPLIIIFSSVLFLGSGFIIGKISGIFLVDNIISGQQTKEFSASGIVLGFEILRNISLIDLLVGYGFFGLEESVPQLLYNSGLYPYFEMIGALEEPQSVGLLNLVLYFGLFQCALVAAVLFKIKKYANDTWLYMLAIFVVILSLTYSSHTIEYLINLFFVFGLSWASTRSLSKKTYDGHTNKILKR